MPPKAIIRRAPRSLPDSTACIRPALAMFSSTISLIPRPACAASSPKVCPTPCSSATCAASMSIASRPSAKQPGSINPCITSASVTVGSVPPLAKAAGPGSEPALSGPTCKRPSRSTCAVEPPPAPISIISITGMRTGMPDPLMNRAARAISNLRALCGRKWSIRHSFAVVPPISKLSTSRSLVSAAMRAARIAPPAGPDSTSRIGKRAAVSIVVMPPLAVIIKIGQVSPSSLKRA